MTGSSGERISLLDLKTVSLGDPPARDLALVNLLKAQVGAFCRTYAKTEIWTSMPSKDVRIEHILLPKAAAKSQTQLAQSVFWELQRQKKFNANSTIYDFEVLGEVDDKGTPKLNITAYTVPVEAVHSVRRLFNQAGISLTGVTIVPFCLQNIFRTGWLGTEQRVAHVFIGTDWSRIDIYSQGNLAFTREIKTGTNSMVQALAESLQPDLKETDAQASELTGLAMYPEPDENSGQEEDKAPDETNGPNGLSMEAKARHMLLHMASHPQDRESAQKIMTVIQPAVDRLVRQIQRTLEFFSQTMSQPPVEITYLAGPLATYSDLVAEISSRLETELKIMDPLPPETTDAKHSPIPSALEDRASLAPAVGLALSDNTRTPNFIHTFREKALSRQESKNHFLASAACLALILGCLGLFGWKFIQTRQGHNVLRSIQANAGQIQETVQKLQSELKSLSDREYREQIATLRQSILDRNTALHHLAKRSVPLAATGEIIRLTPENILVHRLFAYMPDTASPLGGQPPLEIRYESELGKPDSELRLPDPFGTYVVRFAQDDENIPAVTRFVILDGIVTGQNQDLQLVLYQFRSALNASRLFKVRNAAHSEQIYPGLGTVVHFNILLELLI
jgi:type IV pilus assembly protein PilM